MTEVRKGVKPISSDNIRRIFGPHVITEVDVIRTSQGARFAANDQRAYDKPLVAFFRRWSGRIGVALYVLAVLVAMYFAFQLGRGAF